MVQGGGLVPLEGVLAAARDCASIADVEAIAFPQEGIVRDPGTAALLRAALEAGAQVVGGVNARKAGTRVDFDATVLPVFATVAEAMAETGADVAGGFVPPAFPTDSVTGAIDAGIPPALDPPAGVAVRASGRRSAPSMPNTSR